MNNAYQIKSSLSDRAEKYGYRRVTAEKTAPAWLVTLCRIILWFTRDEVRGAVRAFLAIAAVSTLAIVAGAIECGAVPFLHGTVICAVLGAAALIATSGE